MGRYANVILTGDQRSPAPIEPSATIEPSSAIESSATTIEPSAIIKPTVATTEPSSIIKPTAITIEPSAAMGKILVALRYVPSYKNRYRQILLGHTYRFPPPPKGKIDPQSLTEETFSQLQEAYDGTMPWPDFLHQKIAGLDLLVAQEIWHRARSRSKIYGEKKALWIAFREILEIYRQGAFSPRILHFEDGAVRLFSFPLEQHPMIKTAHGSVLLRIQPCHGSALMDKPCLDQAGMNQPCIDKPCRG